MTVLPSAQDRRRVVIERVAPEIDEGRFPIKRTVGEEVVVEADIFADGHDVLSGVLLYRHAEESEWRECPLEELTNDRWRGAFVVDRLGRYLYTVRAWVEPFATWQRDLRKKVDAGADVSVELLVGAASVTEAAGRFAGGQAAALRALAETLANDTTAADAVAHETQVKAALDPGLGDLMSARADAEAVTTYCRELEVVVDPERARFGAWYEFFPRSCVENDPAKDHATLQDCFSRLEYVAGMGFDVVYLPPIHPIGHSHRKGPTTTPAPRPAIPAVPGPSAPRRAATTPSIPSLGTLGRLAGLHRPGPESSGLQVALDLAFQCSPDHPWVTEHPEWFRRRPDGTVQYAENPPKKYEDIYPLDFDTARLARTLAGTRPRGVLLDRAGRAHLPRGQPPHQAVRLLGMADPRRSRREHPDIIFLAEAFTRPKVMYRLAKVGFTQSYTYFTWRNTKWELTEYFTELTQTPVRRVLPAQPLAEHAGHPDGVSADRRAPGVRHPADPRRHPRRQLRHLRPRVRAERERAAGARQRGVPGFGEVPGATLGSRPAGQPTAGHHPA